MNVWLLWILAAVVCGIIEVMSVSFVFLMFAIGALAAGVAAALGASVFVQVIVFAVVSLALLALLRPFLKGRIDRSGGYVRTNTDALIGKTAYVTEAVGERHGRVQFSGGEWSARTRRVRMVLGSQVIADCTAAATAVVSSLASSSHPPILPTALPPDSSLTNASS